MFQLNAPVVIRVKVKEVWNNDAIYSHALPRIHIIGGQRSVRIASAKLFSELKLVTDNLLFMQQPTEKPLKLYIWFPTTAIFCLLLTSNHKHAQSNPFYHPFYPDITSEKRYQALSSFSTACDRKVGGSWDRGGPATMEIILKYSWEWIWGCGAMLADTV